MHSWKKPLLSPAVAAAVLWVDSEFVFCIFVDSDGDGKDDVDLVTLLHLDLPQQTLIRLRLASATKPSFIRLQIDNWLILALFDGVQLQTGVAMHVDF
jgi:hypothetical protein